MIQSAIKKYLLNTYYLIPGNRAVGKTDEGREFGQISKLLWLFIEANQPKGPHP